MVAQERGAMHSLNPSIPRHSPHQSGNLSPRDQSRMTTDNDRKGRDAPRMNVATTARVEIIEFILIFFCCGGSVAG